MKLKLSMSRSAITKIQITIIAAIIIVAAIAGTYIYLNLSGLTPSPEKVLIFGRTKELSTSFDPAYSSESESMDVINNVYDHLYNMDPQLAGEGKIEFYPELAEDFPDVSDDGQMFTIRLRENVRFHDGTPFNASCVKFSFDRLAQIAGGYSFILTSGFSYDRTEVVDNYTIKIYTKAPRSTVAMAIMSSDALAIVSPSAVAKYGNESFGWDGVVGTGPWKFVSWERNVELVLEANDDYFLDIRKPKADKIIYRVFGDPASMRLALENGDIHAGWVAWTITDIVDMLKKPEISGFDSGAGWGRGIMLNTNITGSPLSDVRVRRAICHAIDREEISELVWSDLWPPSYSLLRGDVYETDGGGLDEYEGYEYNVTRATELLTEAGYPDGIDITLTWTPVVFGVEEENYAVVVKEQLAEAGIRATLVSKESGVFLTDQRAGNLESCLYLYAGVYPSADALLSGMAPANSGWSKRIRLNDSVLTDLYNASMYAATNEEWKQYNEQMQERLFELATFVPVARSAKDFVLYRNDILTGVERWIIFTPNWHLWDLK